MFTEESILLREYFFPKIDVKETKELKDLYQHFTEVKVLPAHITYRRLNKVKQQVKINSSLPFSKENNFQKTLVKFQFNHIKVDLHVYSEEINPQFIDEIIHLVRFVGSLSKSKLSHLTLNYYLFDNQKKINGSIFGRNEINSGFCQHGQNTTITIYRKEEVFKVTIHELIHAFEYERVEDTSEIIKHYQKKYNITSNKINTYEAYTEIWANLINCFFISQKVRRSKYNLFLTLIAFERAFCNFQSQKVMVLTGLSDKTIDINQETNVLSYFIIRCEIYEKLTQFLKFCRISNKNYIELNKKKWISFLKKNPILQKKKRIFNKVDKDSFMWNTMRMTLNEIYI